MDLRIFLSYMEDCKKNQWQQSFEGAKKYAEKKQIKAVKILNK
jgi:hypothetical protein